MPRRTYDSKKGRRRPTPPPWTDLRWLIAELERLKARASSHNERIIDR